MTGRLHLFYLTLGNFKTDIMSSLFYQFWPMLFKVWVLTIPIAALWTGEIERSAARTSQTYNEKKNTFKDLDVNLKLQM